MDLQARNRIAHSLTATLSSESSLVHEATSALDRFSLLPGFPYSLLSIAIEGENEGQRIGAATYLKNFTRRIVDGCHGPTVSRDFKNQLLRALLQAEPAVLKVLIEAFRIIISDDVVKKNSWPELVLDLRLAIQNGSLFGNATQRQWKTVNALMILHALLRPFQYFLDPKVANEPVPMLLELIAEEVLVPLLAVFHQFVVKDSVDHAMIDTEAAQALLLVCKCVYFAVRSHMPSTLAPLLSSFCHDLVVNLKSLRLDCMASSGNGYLMKLKTGKRSLKIFCTLITRHRKYSDKLMPDMINSALSIVQCSKTLGKLDSIPERIVSLAFDVISHILETGPGWRLVSNHFSLLLDSAIFPALVMNEKDISDWEEDPDEFMRKNLPSDLEEVSGWREDLFTARKSAVNLLAVISMSKGPPMGNLSNAVSSKRKKSEKNKAKNQRCSVGEHLVLPWLSKFPIPFEANGNETKVVNDYFGVLMGYGGLLDYFREQEPSYASALIQTRILPLYKSPVGMPHLVAPANWVLGELACCLPEEMSGDVYSSLLAALVMPDSEDTSCYIVRVSAGGAIMELLENDYLPPDWLPLLQAIIGQMGKNDEDSSILYQLLSSVVETGNEDVVVLIPYIVSSLVVVISKCMPASSEPWPQMVEKGFAALAVIAQSWENFLTDESEQKESSEKRESDRTGVAIAFSALLQQAWLTPVHQLEDMVPTSSPSCLDDASTLLRSIMLSVTTGDAIRELKISDLLLVWANLIAEWDAWEESEDMLVFDCIQEVIDLQKEHKLNEFIVTQMPSPPNPPMPKCSIIEGIGAFVFKAISQYPSATWRACSCVHMLLHVPNYSFDTECVKQSLAIAFCGAAFSRFMEIRNEPSPLWKPLILAVTSCYVSYPELVERILDKDGSQGFGVWVSALRHVCSNLYEPGLMMESEMKLIVMVLSKIIERHLELGKSCGGLLHANLTSLLEACIRFKEMQDDNDDDKIEVDEVEGADEAECESENYDEYDDIDEDSEVDEHEETEEEFLIRYAKVAASLQDSSGIEEGDVEDPNHEVELGPLESVDPQAVVVSIMTRYLPVVQGQAISVDLISRFCEAFPASNFLFQRHV